MKPQEPASLPASAPSFEPQASAPRFMGKLWTLCNVLEPDDGFCLSVAQAREVWLRFKEDQAHYKRLTIDAIASQDKAFAFLDGERAARARAVLAGVLGAFAALISGVGAGILIDHFLIR